MRRSLMVLAGAAVVAALISSAPFRAFLGFATEGCGGEGDKFVFEGSVTHTEKTVGTDNIRDGKRKDVSDALDAGLTALGGTPDAKKTRDSVQKIFKDDYDAFTDAQPYYNYTVKTHTPDSHVGELKVIWTVRVVILLPANAGTQLKNHELGHLEIEKLLKDLAQKRFEAVSGQIVGKVKTGAEIKALLDPVKAKLDKIGSETILKYDEVTNHGLEGGEDQVKIATETFTAVEAANQ
jgi:hypothetical protein